jgi:hypothetical protein
MARVAVRLFCDNHRHGRHSGVGVVATLGTIAIVSATPVSSTSAAATHAQKHADIVSALPFF